MRFWFSMPFIRRTRIGVSVSDREIARAFHAKPFNHIFTAEERKKQQELRAKEEAEREEKAEALAKRWAPILFWVTIIAYVAFVASMLIWGHYLASKLT